MAYRLLHTGQQRVPGFFKLDELGYRLVATTRMQPTISLWVSEGCFKLAELLL